jgi:hypothetical protein
MSPVSACSFLSTALVSTTIGRFTRKATSAPPVMVPC